MYLKYAQILPVIATALAAQCTFTWCAMLAVTMKHEQMKITVDLLYVGYVLLCRD